jgi:hypothetical protein
VIIEGEKGGGQQCLQHVTVSEDLSSRIIFDNVITLAKAAIINWTSRLTPAGEIIIIIKIIII